MSLREAAAARNGVQEATRARFSPPAPMCRCMRSATAPDPRGGPPIRFEAGESWVTPEFAMMLVRAGIDIFELPIVRSKAFWAAERGKRARAAAPGSLKLPERRPPTQCGRLP